MNWLSNDLYFSIVEESELPEMLMFYLNECYEHFNQPNISTELFVKELSYLHNEDKSFFNNSVYHVLREKNNNNIIGSIKTTYWNKEVILPIQKLFDINFHEILVGEKQNIWHIGRFAISNRIRSGRISILKKLLYNAFYPVYEFENGRILAECDKELTTFLNKIGIESRILGNSIEYIGSETFPLSIESNCLKGFVEASLSRYHSKQNENDFHFFTKRIKLHGKV